MKSKKLAVTLLTGLLAVFNEKLGISPAEMKDVVQLAMAYVVGQGVADVGKHRKV